MKNRLACRLAHIRSEVEPRDRCILDKDRVATFNSEAMHGFALYRGRFEHVCAVAARDDQRVQTSHGKFISYGETVDLAENAIGFGRQLSRLRRVS